MAQGLVGSAPGEEVTGAPPREAAAAPRRAPAGAQQRGGADPPAGGCAESPTCSRARDLRWDLRRGRGEARRGRGAGEAQPGPDRSHRAAAAALFPPRVACPPPFLLPRCGGCCTIWSRVSTRQGAGPQAAWFWGLWDQNPLGVRFVGALPFPLCREVGKLETSCSGTMPDLEAKRRTQDLRGITKILVVLVLSP